MVRLRRADIPVTTVYPTLGTSHDLACEPVGAEGTQARQYPIAAPAIHTKLVFSVARTESA